MIEVDVCGAGAWSRRFADWNGFCAGLEGGEWPDAQAPSPSLLPPAIRRRAPLSVKMAVEVMQQACEQSGMDPCRMATVYSSSFGDIELTDRICSTLHKDPKLTSPTHFHNSVHNAATGYWAIATGVHRPANALSAMGISTAAALLETASQAVFEETPVLLVCGDVQAPGPLDFTTSKKAPLAAAMVLAPVGVAGKPLAKLGISLEEGKAGPLKDERLPDRLGHEPDAFLLNLLATVHDLGRDDSTTSLKAALSDALMLHVDCAPGASAGG